MHTPWIKNRAKDFIFFKATNDLSPATAATRRGDGNRDAPAGFAGAWLATLMSSTASSFHLLIRPGWPARPYSRPGREARLPNGSDHRHRRVDCDDATEQSPPATPQRGRRLHQSRRPQTREARRFPARGSDRQWVRDDAPHPNGVIEESIVPAKQVAHSGRRHGHSGIQGDADTSDCSPQHLARKLRAVGAHEVRGLTFIQRPVVRILKCGSGRIPQLASSS